MFLRRFWAIKFYPVDTVSCVNKHKVKRPESCGEGGRAKSDYICRMGSLHRARGKSCTNTRRHKSVGISSICHDVIQHTCVLPWSNRRVLVSARTTSETCSRAARASQFSISLGNSDVAGE